MKAQILKALAALALITTSAAAQETPMENHTASYIAMPAAEGQTEAFAEFLAGAAPIVADTEPGTVLWFALQDDDTLAIFDIFVDEEARNAHFSGAVAAALNQNADALVAGGWDDGVVANINNSDVLSVREPVDLYSATTATYITLEAAPGKGPELAALLTAAGPIVGETEPGTLFWAALQIDETSFAIFDIFTNNAGREAHFAGQVAGLLNERAAELVAGGWDDGVVANVHNFDILTQPNMHGFQPVERFFPVRRFLQIEVACFGNPLQILCQPLAFQCGIACPFPQARGHSLGIDARALQRLGRCCHVNLSAIGEGIALVGSGDVRSRFPDIKCLQPMEADG